jgi:hypothetical protein
VTTPHPSKSNIVHGYNTRFVFCRQGQHRWPDPSTWNWRVTLGLRRKPLEYRLNLVCETCGTMAIDKIDAHTGEKTRTYRWPDGYRIPSDADVSRVDLRLEMLHRIAGEAQVEETRKASGQ